MSRPRLYVQDLLETSMTLAGYSPHVYYQPPESIKLVYPCIVYDRDRFETAYANGKIYKDMTKYTLTVMDKDPVSPLVDILRAIEYCEMDREFTSDNVHHFVFTFFY